MTPQAVAVLLLAAACLLAAVHDVGAALLVVGGCAGHALPLRGHAVVLADHAPHAHALYDLGDHS